MVDNWSFFSMEGGELFTSIQERADNAFNERGMYKYRTVHSH